MGISVSLVMIAIGAICTFAITAGVQGINISAMGVVLMTVGIAGLLISLLFEESYQTWWRRRGDAVPPARDVEMR